MNKTIGIFAHVDAGKTTFSEQLLFNTHTIRSLGRVDYKTSFLDTNEIEQNRGITIFSGQAIFHYNDSTYYLIDTPGHMDFAAEAERTMKILDYAILLINGVNGVEAHTTSLYQLLLHYHIPVFLFINKMDQETASLSNALSDIENRLTKNIFLLKNQANLFSLSESQKEQIAETKDSILERYLENQIHQKEYIFLLQQAVKEEQLTVCMYGSALNNEGISEFLSVFDQLTITDYKKESHFLAEVYKLFHEPNGTRITYLKLLSGTLQVKQELCFERKEEKIGEKINQIRYYNGKNFSTSPIANAGDVIAVTGLSIPQCGDIIKSYNPSVSTAAYLLQPTLESKVTLLDYTDIQSALQSFRLLEIEDPLLKVIYEPLLKEIHIHIMGNIQLEILTLYLKKRFNLSVCFEKPNILYQESIKTPVMGYGHFEPLRHYAEVHVRLEPAVRGSGITFESECHVDTLPLNFQHLIQSHVFEKKHKGILTGFPLTDVKIILVNGRSHIKHTEGGDFREATYRAIRQALEKTESILLEPYYKFEIYTDYCFIGKILSDIQKMSGTFDPPLSVSDSTCSIIHGRAPVSEFMEYTALLTSFTKGSATINLQPDAYDICHNTEEVIKKIGYQKDSDLENSSSSVFCAKGQSFIVPWDKAESYMHCL